jgi:hypothetical protein
LVGGDQAGGVSFGSRRLVPMTVSFGSRRLVPMTVSFGALMTVFSNRDVIES